MQKPAQSKVSYRQSNLESILIEEYRGVEILISSQHDTPSSENLFLKGDMVLNNDRITFKGMHRMQYFCFFLKIYNLLSITRNSDYIVFSISDLANVVQDHLMHRDQIFDSQSGLLLESEMSNKLFSRVRMKQSTMGSEKKNTSSLMDRFKEGKEFELSGDFQIRVIMRNQVRFISLKRSGIFIRRLIR